MPHSRNCSSEPVRPGWNCSAFHTPSWHHTELTTRTSVLTLEKGTFSFSGPDTHCSGTTARIVKYIANSPAKNMSSLESQTIVPTEAMFGRLTTACVGPVSTADAVATGSSMAPTLPGGRATPRRVRRGQDGSARRRAVGSRTPQRPTPEDLPHERHADDR